MIGGRLHRDDPLATKKIPGWFWSSAREFGGHHFFQTGEEVRESGSLLFSGNDRQQPTVAGLEGEGRGGGRGAEGWDSGLEV